MDGGKGYRVSSIKDGNFVFLCTKADKSLNWIYKQKN